MNHIVFGQSAFGTLKYALKGKDEAIIYFPDYFGEGPIHQLLTKEGFEARLNWLEKALHLDKNDYNKSFLEAIKQIEQLQNDAQIIIWTCENAAEQFGLRLVCHLLAQKKCTISVCNTYFNILKLYNSRIEVRHTGEVNAEQVLQMLELDLVESLSIEERSLLQSEAIQLMEGHSIIRTWKDGTILEDDETRDDAEIIRYAKELLSDVADNEFIIAARLIGQVYGLSNHDIRDTWIEYRIQSLIDKGVLEYLGDLSEMRLYQVRVRK